MHERARSRALSAFACHAMCGNARACLQGPEITGADLCDLRLADRSWEFNPAHPVRSALGPYATAGIAHAILCAADNLFRRAGAESPVSGLSLLYGPRFVLFLMLLGIERLIETIVAAGDAGISRRHVRCALRSSWVGLLFLTRPFSNTIEAFVLVGALWLHMRLSHVALGWLVGFGLFVRPTLLFFTLPLFFLRSARDARAMLIGCSCACLVGTIVDTLYFESATLLLDARPLVRADWPSIVRAPLSSAARMSVNGSWTFAPLNFVAYNSQERNLAAHGVHPRWTHVVANLPQLIGPLVVYVLPKWLEAVRVARVQHAPANAILLTTLSGLACLSLAPHQEPRFLVPLALPLTALFAPRLFGEHASMPVRAAWYGSNLLQLLAWAGLHQAGVTRAMATLPQLAADAAAATGAGVSECRVLSFHTYMVPRHLLLARSGAPDAPPPLRWEVLDLMGGSVDGLHRALLHDPSAQQHDHAATAAARTRIPPGISDPASVPSRLCFVLAPSTVLLNAPGLSVAALSDGSAVHNDSWSPQHLVGTPVASFWPHWSSEDPPQLGEALTAALRVYRFVGGGVCA
jgi:phosphatidylinositol glycan class Z